MINTKIFEIIIFCFKILFYQFDTTEADIEVLNNGKYEMTIHYEQRKEALHVSAVRKGEEEQLFEVRTLDNALYQVEIPGEEPFRTDLAYLYKAVDWDQLGKTDMVLFDEEEKATLEIRTGTSNVYINIPMGEQTYVIKKSSFLPD